MKTHPLDISALVVGLIFLGLAGAWALRAAGVVDADAAGWVLPLLLVIAGTVGIGAAVLKNARPARNDDDHDADHDREL